MTASPSPESDKDPGRPPGIDRRRGSGQSSRNRAEPKNHGASNNRDAPAGKERRPAPLLKVDADDNEETTLDKLQKSGWENLPSALVSLVVHLLLLLVIAFLTLPGTENGRFSLFLETADPDENFDQTFEISSEDDFQPETIVAPTELSTSDDANRFQPQLMSAEASMPTPVNPSKDPKFALSGRGEMSRRGLLLNFGGTEETEDAVDLGLKWLARNQRRDGSWSLKGPYRSNVSEENSMAATGLALLAFLGHGETHQSGEYQKVVSKGIRAMLKMQSGSGHFVERRASISHSLYSHAICSIALCELLALTQDESLIGPSRDAIAFAAKAQGPQGGWKYEVNDPRSDLSVTGWFVMLFQSAKYAGIDYDPEVLTRAEAFIDSVMTPDGSQFRYEPDHQPKLSMTAEGLLCRQYLGWEQDDPRLQSGCDYLLKNPIRWSQKNVYYWYYATQVMRHMEDERWEKWNTELKAVLPEKQVKSGVDKGSWDPQGDPYGGPGGRLYVTCLSIYCLEVYYRHLPLYRIPGR